MGATIPRVALRRDALTHAQRDLYDRLVAQLALSDASFQVLVKEIQDSGVDRADLIAAMQAVRDDANTLRRKGLER